MLAEREAQRRLAVSREHATVVATALAAAQIQHASAHGVQPSGGSTANAQAGTDGEVGLGADPAEAGGAAGACPDELIGHVIRDSARATVALSGSDINPCATTAGPRTEGTPVQAGAGASAAPVQPTSQAAIQSAQHLPIASSRGIRPPAASGAKGLLIGPRVSAPGGGTGRAPRATDLGSRGRGGSSGDRQQEGEITEEVGMAGFEDVLSAWAAAVGLDPHAELESSAGELWVGCGNVCLVWDDISSCLYPVINLLLRASQHAAE